MINCVFQNIYQRNHCYDILKKEFTFIYKGYGKLYTLLLLRYFDNP